MITAQDQQQWGYLLDPCFQLVNTAGKPLTNGYLEVYVAGTRVKYYCASDFDGTLHPFQIPLDSLGANIVLADPANSYDVYVYNAFGSLIMSRYNVKVSAASGGGLPAQYEAEYWFGQNGASQPINGDELGQTLALPLRPDYQGDFIDRIGWGYINGDEVNEYPKYLYLKPGIYLVNCVIRFQQQSGTEVNRLDELLVYTGNGNADEDVAWQLDETGPLTSGDRHCLKMTFIRKVLAEGESSTVDTDYSLYFAPATKVNWSNAYIQKLQIVKLDSKGGAGTQTYIPGDYISIIGNVISVTGVLPESATADFVQYSEYNAEIQNIHNEIDNLEITVQNATSQIVEQTTEIVTSIIEEVAPPMVTSIIERELAGVTGDFATRDELESATGNLQDQIDNIQPGVQSDWDETDPEDPSYIQNKPDLDIYATHDELQSATGEIITIIETVTGNVPTGAVTHEELENATSVLQNEIENATSQIPTDVVTHEELANVTSQIPTDVVTHQELANVTAQIPTDVVTHTELENATSILQNEIDNIPAQVQSDWAQSATGEPDYIKNKPDLSVFATKGELTTATSNLQTEIETVTGDVIDTVTSMIPAAQVQSDWTESDTSDPSYIQNKPSEKTLVEGENVHITASGDYIVISAEGGQPAGDYIERDELENVTSQIESEIENVTSQIPSDVVTHAELEAATANIPAQVQSDWTQTATGDPSYIKHKPDVMPLVPGQNISINEVNGEIVISAAGGGGTVTGDYVERDELESVTSQIESVIENATGNLQTEIETVTGDVIDTVTSMIPAAQVQSDWTQTATGDPSYIKHKPDTLPLVEGENITINEVNGEIVISAAGGVTGDFVEQAELESVTSEIQSEIESVTATIPADKLFIAEYNVTSYNEICAALQDGKVAVLERRGTSELHEPYVIVYGIISRHYMSIEDDRRYLYVDLAEKSGDNVRVTRYTLSAPAFGQSDNSTWSYSYIYVTPSSFATKTEVAAATGEIQADIETVSSMITPELPVVGGTGIGITETSTEITIAVTGDYATHGELATATAAVEADIPDVSNLATKAEVTAAINTVTGMIPDLNDLNTAGITDIQVVNALPASPVSTVLYLVRE